ncbi:MAG: hypothetical protein ACE5H3_04785 [Planctomycetota bacterium]
MTRFPLVLAAGLVCLAAPLAAQSEQPLAPDPVLTAFHQWQAQNGPHWILRRNPATGTARFLYGGRGEAVFTPQTDAEFIELARMALEDVHAIFFLDSSTLTPRKVKHLDLSRIGTSDKVAVLFDQEVQGVPVVHGYATVLFDPQGSLLAVDTTGLPDLAGLSIRPLNDPYAALTAGARAFRRMEGRKAADFGEPELRIYPLQNGRVVEARLAWAVEMRSPSVAGELPSGRRMYVAADRQSPVVLGNDQLVHTQGPNDISGTIQSWATPGVKPDVSSNAETQQVMPFMNVTSPAGNATTDENGFFIIPNAGGAATVTARYTGPFVRVDNQAGGNHSASKTFTPGTPDTLTLNNARTEQITAQANSFNSVMAMRAFVKRGDPSDTTMDFQILAKPNENSTCNAFFDGSSINFFLAGGSCVNTAYSTVVVHEEGHWANIRYGSGNGSDGFGEGNSDVYAMYTYDGPIVGRDFAGPGNNIRTGNNTRQFCGDSNPGCYGEVHNDGEVLMGALWKVRRNLKSTLGAAAGGALTDGLFSACMNTFNDGSIKTIIEDHWLALDDDDGNVGNGTPDMADIDGAFREQGFPGVTVDFMTFTHTPLGDTQDESGPYTVTADIVPLVAPSINSAKVVYSIDSGAPQNVAMVNTAGNTWSAGIPGQQSVASVAYHIEATDSLGNTARDPETGDFSFFVGVVQTIAFFDFEPSTDEGWTHGQVATQDDWQRGIPFGKVDDPSAAFSGTKIWGNDLGRSGWNGAYQSNVSNWLQSPAFDLSGKTGARIRFQRWLNVEDGSFDQARVKVNGNVIWSNSTTGDTHDTSWSPQEFDISSVADNNASVKVRFEMVSDSGVEFGGWNIDDFEILTIAPVPGGTDTIVLTGPASVQAGNTATFDFNSAPASSPYILYASKRMNGTMINGHPFDIGPGLKILNTGTTTLAGTGSFTSNPVRSRFINKTFFLEVRVDSGGQIFDSNPVSILVLP